MQKTMYEKVGEYRIARENNMFHYSIIDDYLIKHC